MLYLNYKSGSFGTAPFLDVHGEPDPELKYDCSLHNCGSTNPCRRGRQQYLHQKRYDLGIRSMLLHHQIPSYIARKMENVSDAGGWETL